MNIEIKKLHPELLNDYLHFFDTTSHDDGVDEHKCYCVCWSSTDCSGDDDSTVDGRRNLAIEYVNGNYIQGYLAYENNKVVGWCNSNTKTDCLDSRCGRMYLRPLNSKESSADFKIKSVLCFVIAPEMRRKGIAGMLLQRVCEDAKQDGFDFVEAYPVKEFISPQHDFVGPAKLYEKLGFTIYCDLGDRLVVRKELKYT